MKVAIGIILVAIIMAALVLYLLLIMNSHDLAFCGDIPQTDGANVSVTRIYTADFNANETLSEIVNRMNANESGNMSAEELTEILATYQNISYAPVFLFNLAQEDNNTFVLSGSVYNGITPEGAPITADFMYRNLTLTAGVPDGKMLAVQNVYSDYDEDGERADPARYREVKMMKVDTMLRGGAASYIKIDVEGSEENALRGAAETIANFRPKLNVALYHRNEDMFELPLLVNKLNKKYKLYMRHHPYIPDWETNLYCI